MVRLIAKFAYTYADKSLKVGDEFEAPEKDAHLLTVTGRAVPADKPKRKYQRRDLVAES